MSSEGGVSAAMPAGTAGGTWRRHLQRARSRCPRHPASRPRAGTPRTRSPAAQDNLRVTDGLRIEGLRQIN